MIILKIFGVIAGMFIILLFSGLCFLPNDFYVFKKTFFTIIKLFLFCLPFAFIELFIEGRI